MSLFGKKENSPHWTQETHLFKDDAFVCSACGYRGKKGLETCPGCGAKMSKTKYYPSWVDEAEMMDIIFCDD